MGRCGGARAACTGRGPGCEGWGGGYRSCAERTENIHCMAVTLDVSKLSGWLNFDAACRVERRAHDAGRGVDREAGKRGLAAAHERHARSEGPAVKAGGARACAERTLNISLMPVTLDVSKLSGWLNFDAACRVERRGVRCGARSGPGAGGRGPAAAHERHAQREGPAVKAGEAIGHARSAPGTSSPWL